MDGSGCTVGAGRQGEFRERQILGAVGLGLLQRQGLPQYSYERSSQAQSLTCPPILLYAAGYLDSRRTALRACRERMLN